MARKRDVVKKIDQKTKASGAPLPLIQEDQPAPPAFYLIPAPDTLVLVGQAILRSTQAPLVSVALSWQEAPNIAPDYYNVEWDESSSFTNVQRKRASTTSATIDGLKANGVTYYFRVQAVLGGIYSPFSETLTVVTMTDTTPPPDVTGLSATFINGDLYISWTKPLSEIYKDAEIRIYNAAHSILYATLYSSGQSIRWSVEQNFAATGGVGATSVSIDVLSRSWGNTYSTGVNTTATSTAPSAPTITTSWDSDIGLADEDLLITWPVVTNTDSYDITIDGTTYKTKDLRFVYRYETNVAQHVPTLASGDMSLTLAVYARNKLNQVSTPANTTVANLAPPTAYIQLGYTTGFSHIAANATVASGAIIQDFDHWEWILTDGVNTIQTFNSTTNDVIFTINDSGTYNIGVKAVDKFNQKSSYVVANSIAMDVLTIEHLRAEAIYTDDVGNSQTTLNALKDGDNGTTVLYAGLGAGVWHWTKVERPLVERYGQVSIVVASGAPNFYVGLSLDDITYTWYSGTLSGTYNTKLTLSANETTAKSLAVTTAELIYNRIDIPTVKEARYVKIGHRSDSAYTLGLLYPRRLLQTDDFEAETVATINLKAGSVTADKISVINLQAVSASMGTLDMDGVISIAAGGGIYQGTGTFASPTTGLKIFNSSGVGKLSTYNAGVEQITLDTDGKFKAGAGNIIIDANGIQVVNNTTSEWSTGGYKLIRSSGLNYGVVNGTGGNFGAIMDVGLWNASTQTFVSRIQFDYTSSGDGLPASGYKVQIIAGTKSINIFQDSDAISFLAGNVYTSGTLHVGSATAADNTNLQVARGSGTNGTAVFNGTTYSSHFNYSTAENTYIRGGKAGAVVYINDQSTGGVVLANSGGNVGIGTTGPGKVLHVHSTTVGDGIYVSNAAPGVQLGNNAAYGSRTNGFVFGLATAANHYIAGTAAGDGVLFTQGANGGTAGALYIGVNGIAMGMGTANNVAIANKMYIGGTGTVPSYQIHLSTDSAGKPTTSTWSVVSDSRSKKNISNRTNALERIAKLQIKEFDFTGDFGTEKDRRSVGVIAEDMTAIYPNSVRTVDIAGEQILAVDYHEAFVDALVALQELKAELELLKAKVK